MNYYEHHIGDYDADTAHLSWHEDMAYTRLMRLYYRKELPIPCDLSDACRLIRAVSREQRQAVESVLKEFFKLDADGWHQKRCDADIERYQRKAEHNRVVGKLGGRPRKVETQDEPGNNPGGLFLKPKQNPLQTPDTRHQTPEEKEKKPQAPPWLTLAEVMADGLSEEVAAAWLAHRRAKKAKLTAFAWSGFKAEVVKAGWELEAAVLKAIARNWASFEEKWVRDDRGGSLQPGQKPNQPKTFAERDSENRRARIREMTGGLMGGEPTTDFDFIDMEDGNGRLLG